MTGPSYIPARSDDCAAWFALHVKCRYERAIAFALRQKGFADFVPVNRVKHKWCDRVKTVEIPLFPGYVFCHFDLRDRLQVAMTPGVISIVGTGRNPTPVDDSEIVALTTVVAAGVRAEPHEYLPVGTVISIAAGPLQGLRGILSQTKRHSLVISVTLLQRSVSVELDADLVVPLHRRFDRAALLVTP